MLRRNCLAIALMSVCGSMVHAAEKVGIKPETVPGRADYPEPSLTISMNLCWLTDSA